MKRKVIFSSILLLIGILIPFGLYSSEVEFPLIQSFSYFPYSDNSILEKGKISGALDMYYSNIYMFNGEETIINDGEVFSATMGLRYGFGKTTTFELYYRHSFMFGGYMDKLIEDFHKAFKLPDDRRPDYPRNSVHYWFKDYYNYIDNQNSASPLILGVLKEIYRSQYFSIKGRLALGLPISRKAGFSSNKPFLTVGLIFKYQKRKFSLEAANYLSFFKTPSWINGEDISPFIVNLNLEGRLGFFIGGFIFRSSVFKEDDIAHDAYQVYFGFKITRQLELIILEDFYPFDTTPDISFQLRIKVF